jgi:hypothetical protein
MVEQISVFLENTAGRLAELTRALGDAGVNMHALMVADTSEFGVVRIISDEPERAKLLLEESGFSASITPVIAVEVPDRPAGLAELLEALGASGMGVEYAYCFVQPTGEYAVDVLKIDDSRAEQVLIDAGFRPLTPADLYTPDA